MVMATMKCWQEKNYKDMPPIILVDKKIINNDDSGTKENKKK
jgi:hypothetical protein